MQFQYFSRLLAENFHVLRKRIRLSSPQPSRPQKLQKKNWTNQEGFLRVQWSGALRGSNFGRNQNFLTFGQWASSWQFLRETFLTELSTPHSICPEKTFETKVFFLKKNKFDFFSDLEWSNSGFVSEFFNKGVKNKIHVTRRSFS